MSSRRNLVGALAAAASIAFSFPGSANAMNLLANGGFENTAGFLDNTGGNTMRLFPGSTVITGWTVLGAGGEIAWVGPTNPYGIVSSERSYSLDLTGYHDGAPYGGVSQTVATCAGCTYSLSFSLGSVPR